MTILKVLISWASELDSIQENVLGRHNPPETSGSVAAMAARRAGTGSQIRVHKFSGGRQEPAAQHFGSQRPHRRRSGSLLFQRRHRRIAEHTVLELVWNCLRNRSSRRPCHTISRVSHCTFFSVCVCARALSIVWNVNDILGFFYLKGFEWRGVFDKGWETKGYIFRGYEEEPFYAWSWGICVTLLCFFNSLENKICYIYTIGMKYIIIEVMSELWRVIKASWEV